jgi:hypothetical protein
MDNKTVFVRTSKGEDEAHSRTMHLPGDIRRALMMVDGTATFGEISKRAAPSLRAGLDAMLQELEKGGYIADKSRSGSIPKMPIPPKIAVPPKMAMPNRVVTPQKKQPSDEGGDLDFMSGFSPSVPKPPAAEPDRAKAEEERLRAEAEEKAAQEIEIEAAKFRAQQDAADLLRKAEEEAARVREEAEREKQRIAAEARAFEEAARRAKKEAEAADLIRKAEEEAARVREEAEREKQRIAAEAHALEEAARRAKEEAEAARIKAEQLKARLEAEAKALHQAEAARKIAEQEAAAREAAQRVAREEREAARVREEDEKRSRQEAAAKLTEAKPEAFTFDTFQVDESQLLPTQHKAGQPELKPKPTEAAPAGRPGEFKFESFQIETRQQPAELPKKEKTAPLIQPEMAANAARPAEAQKPVRHEEAPPVAAKPSASTPTQEEIERASQERIATEKRIKEEELAAKKQAEAQAKAHAEAEQRAAAAAKAEMEQAAKQVKYAAETPPPAKPTPAVRARRKPFSLGNLVGLMFKLGAFLLVLLVGALFVAPYALPTRDYIPKVERFLSAKLSQPVHVGYLSGRILPTPRLELGEVSVGKVKQFQADQALVYFALSGLVIETKPISSIELQGVKVSGSGLQSVSEWLQQMAADNQYPVESIVIGQGTLDAGAVQLAGTEGTLSFNSVGEFTNANLRSNDGKYALDMNAALGGKLQVAITVRGSALPLLPGWQFEELTAKGELSNNGLSISEFQGGILDGILQGNATVDWRSGWRAQGNIVAKTISMQRLNQLLEGRVEGAAHFKMSAQDLGGLSDSAVLDGSFTSRNGVIGGMDIVETARTLSREHLPGGRTHFDGLSGNFTYANKTLHLKQVKITSDVLNAAATLDVVNQQMSGSVIARLTIEEGMKPVNLQISGVTDRPTLRFAP